MATATATTTATEANASWLYFDFAQCWQQFFAAWRSPIVQETLAQGMQQWCAARGVACTWEPGGALWPHSCGAYWQRAAEQRAREHAISHRLQRRFEEAMALLGRRFPNRRAAAAAFDALCLPALAEAYLPQPGTVEWILLMGGRSQVVVPALEEVARQLFPLDRVSVGEDAAGDQVVVVESQKLLFDPFGYYYFYRLGRPGYDPATCAAELLEPSWQLFGPNDVM